MPRRSSTCGSSTTTTSGPISRSGMVPPWERFKLAAPNVPTLDGAVDDAEPVSIGAGDDAAGRRRAGTISFATATLQGRRVAGRPDRRGRLRRRAGADPSPWRADRDPRPPPPDRQADRRARNATASLGRRARSATAASVTRKVDSSGNVCFAGTNYRVGNKYRRRQVQVAVVGDTVEISVGERAHPLPPDHATTAPANTARSPTPAADPTASTPPDPTRVRRVRQVPGPKCQAGTGA